MQTKKFKTRCTPSLCNSKMVLKKEGKNSMQTEEDANQGLARGHPTAYGLIYYLYDSLLDSKFEQIF
jgi:hypothetical protein